MGDFTRSITTEDGVKHYFYSLRHARNFIRQRDVRVVELYDIRANTLLPLEPIRPEDLINILEKPPARRRAQWPK